MYLKWNKHTSVFGMPIIELRVQSDKVTYVTEKKYYLNQKNVALHASNQIFFWS